MLPFERQKKDVTLFKYCTSVFFFYPYGYIFLPVQSPADKNFTRPKAGGYAFMRFGTVLPGNRREAAKILPVLKTKKITLAQRYPKKG